MFLIKQTTNPVMFKTKLKCCIPVKTAVGSNQPVLVYFEYFLCNVFFVFLCGTHCGTFFYHWRSITLNFTGAVRLMYICLAGLAHFW